MASIREIIAKAGTIETGSLNAGGLLNPEQARRFIQQTFDATNLNQIVRHEMRRARSGEIDKIGIDRRIVREKVENVDDGYRAGVKTSQIKYNTTAIRLPWEITEDTLRENIEGQAFEQIVTDLMTQQLGIDCEDLYLNGDEATPEKYDTGSKDGEGQPIMADTPDYNFLKINDGWIKQIANGGHVYDKSAADGMSLDFFYKALQAMPNKYNNGKLRWLMSPRRAQEWELYLLNMAKDHGGHVPDNMYTAPARIPIVECPSLDDTNVILTNPQNLIVVNTYDVKIRKTTEGESAIMQDKRFYVVHLDYDPIIEELNATTLLKLPPLAV